MGEAEQARPVFGHRGDGQSRARVDGSFFELVRVEWGRMVHADVRKRFELTIHDAHKSGARSGTVAKDIAFAQFDTNERAAPDDFPLRLAKRDVHESFSSPRSVFRAG